MNKNKQLYGLIGSILFFIATGAAFYWLWTTSQAPATGAIISAPAVADISGLKDKAKTLISGRENLSGIPVLAPTADKVGRDNPFAAQ